MTLPLVLTWALGATVTASVAAFFTNKAFDSSLLDDAYMLASRVERQGTGLRLAMSPADIKTVLFDQNETMVFAAWAADGTVFAGQPGLDRQAFGPGDASFARLQFAGTDMHGVMLRRRAPLEFSLVVAHATANRQRVLQRLLAYSALPQLMLLGLFGLWLRQAISQSLAPLSALSAAVDQCHADDLATLPPELADAATSLDVQRLGMALNAMMRRVGASVQAQREFTGSVAHELRTPLAGIRALAEYGLAKSTPDVWREQLQAVVQSQGRASHLIDQLLALAMADEARVGLPMTDVALDAVAHDVVLRFMRRADQAGVDLGAQGLDAPVHVRANVALVEGVLTNLIDNALRHGCAPGTNGMVTVGLSQDESGVTLCVSDNGSGMSPAMRRKNNVRWAHRQTGQPMPRGAGLGLAIVERYAALMNARFELSDGQGGCGLVACLLFPAGLPERSRGNGVTA